METSKETRERPQHQQHQRHVAGDPKYHRLQTGAPHHMAMLPYELYAGFDLLTKESAVTSAPPPEDWTQSVSTAHV